MKRKITAIATASILMCGVAAGCGGGFGVVYEPEEDATKSYLYIDTPTGGFGSEYLSVVAQAFEAANAEKSYAENKTGVKIDVSESSINKDTAFKNGVGSASSDVHVVEGLYYTDLLGNNSILDVTDIVTSTLSDGKTIESKLNTEQQKVLKSNGKYYTLPTFAGYTGITYNAGLFKDNNLYFADSTVSPSATSSYTGKAYTGRPFVNNSKETKSPGPDGKYKTSDDGLPSSYEEFFYMCDAMYDAEITPLIYYGETEHYSNYIFQELLCAASTANGLNAMFSFDSNGDEIEVITEWEGETPKTSKVVINEDNGYLSRAEMSRYKAIKFMKHLSRKENKVPVYIEERSFGKALSNVIAQEVYMKSSFASDSPIAMLAEGVYWYNEAAGSRAGLIADGYEEEVANLNLQYMPLPAQEYGTVKEVKEDEGITQLVADALQYYLVVNAKVGSNPEKLALAKDFIKFMYSDEMLQKMTVTSGIPFALKYDLTDAQYGSMNKLSQSFWDVYKGAKDKDAYITGLSTSPIFLNYTTQFSFKSTSFNFKSKVNGADTGAVLHFFYNNQNATAKAFFEGMQIKNDWEAYKTLQKEG